jgi:hypothetical protein
MHKLTLSEHDLRIVAAALEYLRTDLLRAGDPDTLAIVDDAALLRDVVAEKIGLSFSV